MNPEEIFSDPEEIEQIEKKTQRQEELGGQIEAVVRNYKKDGPDRKNLHYYKQRLQKIQQLQAEFVENDDWLESLDTQQKTSGYFTNKYAILIKNLASQYAEIFTKEIKKLTNSATENSEMESKLIKLIRRQQAIMSSLKRLLEATVPKDAAASSLKAKEKLWEQIQELHFTIAETSENPIANGYNMDTYLELETKMSTTLSEDQIGNAQTLASSNVPLPKINIPKFNGNYAEWPTFFDLFQKVIHEQPISSVQKMWYLKTNLTGEAERLIRHLNLTENNYDTAWGILKDRFNNKRILAASILEQIMEHPNVTSDSATIKAFHDIIQESLSSLINLGVNTKHWDPMLLHVLVKKLDRHTHILYESAISNPTELQTVSEFLNFLQQRFQALELMGNKQKEKKSGKEHNKATSSLLTSSPCKMCGDKNHPIYYCEKFKAMNPEERLKWVQSKALCVKCFKADHKTKLCKQRGCKRCNKGHNTLLHLERSKETKSAADSAVSAPSLASSSNSSSENSPVVVTAASSKGKTMSTSYVLLATAKIKIIASNGQTCEIRAVLDAGSQVNLITERVIKRLSLSTRHSQLDIEGIGQRNGQSRARLNVKIQSKTGNFETTVDAFVLPQIISPQPSQNLDVKRWKIPKDIELADPQFFKSEKIDMLIGAEFYHHLLCPEQIQIGPNLPLLQKTMFGWIVIGKTNIDSSISATCAIYTEQEALANTIEKFWKIEDIGEERRIMTKSELECETHFSNTVCRDAEGRFVVRLPFLKNPSELGESKQQALKRLVSLQCRLNRNPGLKRDYIRFMQEYEELGHMERIAEKDIPQNHYFIPHHCVQKPDSTTTKLRVVFDATAKTTSGLSLNDILRKGPTVQSDLVSILLRFRIHRFVFTADIEKMYRQIKVNKEDRAQQLIVWRSDSCKDFQYYRLNTVTYGTTSAPYLATKCLQYLASTNISTYPLGAATIRDDFYVDDCLSGANDITTAQEIQRQTSTLLQKGGFKLRKYCANHAQLLANIPAQDQEVNLDFDDDTNYSIKTLGLIWIPNSDELCGRASISNSKNLTKRTVLSDLARIFDPLGLFGPITVKAKIFMQQLWNLQLSWDDELPSELQHEWNQFRNSLIHLNSLKTHRHIYNRQVPSEIQIHTFVDASEQAYGAAIYIRAKYANKTITNRLLCAKSRVAPKKKLTIPRLELCAAAIGAELTKRIRDDLRYTHIPTFLWTDSTIVLSWIQSSVSLLHNFVANRISRIQTITHTDQWHHVSSKDNPADILSRGVNPEKLIAGSMWFYGPLFLYGTTEWWLQPDAKVPEVPNDIEKRTSQVVAITHTDSSIGNLIGKIEHRNSFTFLQNVVGYLRRPFLKQRPPHNALSPSELRMALITLVKTIQESEFEKEINDLKNHKTVANSSKLSSLAPFIDAEGVLRVGGRLEASSIPYDAKHPMLLPFNDPVVKLLFKQKHEEFNHCGSQTLLSILRQNFWPIKGKITARNTIHNCVRCSRAKPALMHQVMGNLPEDRVTMARPFLKTGVDYCGPFWIHYKIRGKKPTKAYLAIFCCFATRAVHMELVTDLTTNAFLGALTRFTSRRGRCQSIYCDNATNFSGAKNQLQELSESVFSKDGQETIIKESSKKGIDFKFIPPRAPHFGGLWEAAVKSAKYLLLRSVSTASLTYEELETVIIGIEAILNSRPLTSISSDPNDLVAITPGHFLIGEPLTALPDPHKEMEKTTLFTRWQLVSKLKYEFWKRWSREYLNELQHRYKWKTESENLKENDMVIIKEENLPTMKWPIGRIQKIYRGNDGRIRVAEVRTSNGIYKRAVHLLAPLPTTSSINTDKPEIKESYDTPHTSSNTTKPTLVVSIPLNRLSKTEHLKPASKGDDTDFNVPPQKRGRMSNSHLMTTILVAFLLLPLILAEPVNIKRFNAQPGIYFEDIGTTRLTTAHWKLVVYYDLNPIWSDIKNLQAGMATLKNLCQRPPAEPSCMSLINHFHHSLNTIMQEEGLLLSKRYKRAALDIVGNVANALFGVLDSEYADNMSKTIDNVKQNEQHLLKLLRNQTSVIDSTLNIIRKDETATASNFKRLQDVINEDMNNIENETSLLRRSHQLIALVTQLSMITTTLQQTQSELLHALTQSNNGKISSLILTPNQLEQELQLVKAHLPTGRALPADSENLLDFYKLITVRTAINEKHVIFLLHLPLVDHQTYTLFKLTAIPAALTNSTVAIKPNVEFLAINDHHDQFAILSKEEFITCTSIDNSLYICPNQQSRYGTCYPPLDCIIQISNNKTTESCEFVKIYNTITFTPLFHLNSWVYATSRTIELSAVCDGSMSRIMINGSGIINIHSSCILKNSIITLQGHEERMTQKTLSYAAFGSIPEAVKDEFNMKRLNLKTLSARLENITYLQEKLKISDFPTNITQISTHTVVSYSALASVILLLIVYTAWKITKCYRKRQFTTTADPQPMPRQRNSFCVTET